MSWSPPSSELIPGPEGVWESRSVSQVSYPEEGNNQCYQVEDDSFWFVHRNRCIQALFERLSPPSPIYDVGGGNGFVSMGLQQANFDTVLVEPGSGAYNARRRGVEKVIHAALEDIQFPNGSIDCIACFDVIEHIPSDTDFLEKVYRALKPGGYFICTVPAERWLWSTEDYAVGHHRRYTDASLRSTLEKCGFTIDYLTHFFSWLPGPMYLRRALPYQIGKLLGRKAQESARDQTISDHDLPRILKGPVERINAWEVDQIRRGEVIRVGTSLLCAARVSARI